MLVIRLISEKKHWLKIGDKWHHTEHSLNQQQNAES